MMSPDRTDRRGGRNGKGCLPRLESLESRQLLTGGNDALEKIIGAAAVRDQYKVDGSGLSAAMIDTGVDYTNPALGGDGYGPGHKVVDGWDFSKSEYPYDPTKHDGAPPVTNPYPINPHGTTTAGIVASTDATYPGVAPGANIVALRVFADDDSGDFDDVANALQYALDNHIKDHISVVNISISDGGNYSYDFFTHDNSIGQKLAGLIHQLDLLDIPVVAAAGNSFAGAPGMGFPAILTETISVAATDKDDQLLPNAQRLGTRDGFAAATDLLAPGKDFTAITNGGFSNVEGSSFSAPIVTGGIILLQSIYEKWYGTLPKVDDLRAWLKGGATTIHDGATASDYGRIDILKAASLIPKPPAVTPPPATPTTQIYVNGTLQATVPATATANPLSDFGSGSGFAPDFDLIQIWQNGQSTTISLPQTDNSVGGLFSKVEIFNAQPAGKLIPIADTSPNAPAPAASTVKQTITKAFQVGQAQVTAKKLPKPSGFARGHHKR